MLKKRIITAAILIPITLAILFFLPVMVFGYLTSFVVLAAAWEWAGLIGLDRKATKVIYVLLTLLAIFVSLFVPVELTMLIASCWWVAALVSVTFYPRASGWWSANKWLQGIMGIFALVPCWVALTFMRAQLDGVYALLFLFILIWGADSTAYFVGKRFGKRRLAAAVSPGKSVEGVVGALIFAVVITLFALWWSEMPLPGWPWALVLSLLTVVFSIVGDLFESMIKRNSGVKDSGQLLPGHGGLLDRIDSLTAAAPIYVLGALLLGSYL